MSHQSEANEDELRLVEPMFGILLEVEALRQKDAPVKV